jgi:hypothetical protein
MRSNVGETEGRRLALGAGLRPLIALWLFRFPGIFLGLLDP